MGHGSNLPGSTPVPSRLAATYPMHLTEPQTVKAFVTPKGLIGPLALTIVRKRKRDLQGMSKRDTGSLVNLVRATKRQERPIK